MKPTPELVLNHAFAKIAMEMGPALPPGYGQGSATITGVLLLMVAQEFNRAADIRAKENARDAGACSPTRRRASAARLASVCVRRRRRGMQISPSLRSTGRTAN